MMLKPSAFLSMALKPMVFEIGPKPRITVIMDSKEIFGFATNQKKINRKLMINKMGKPNPKKEKNHVLSGLTNGDK